MGIFTSEIETRSTLNNPDDVLWKFFTGQANSSAGVAVNETTAMGVTAVYACINVLAQGISSLPCHLYERIGERAKKRVYGNPLYSILHDSPNPEMTAIDFFETSVGHAAGWGNSIINIEWSKGGRVKALWPLRPDTEVRRVEGKLWYIARLSSGEERKIPSDEILHIHGLGYDGINGYHPLRKMAEAIGLAIATEKHGANFFGSGALPGLALTHPGVLGEKGHSNLRKSWEKMHKGIDNTHRLAILEEGIKIEKIGIPPNDSQFIESREFQAIEICRIYRMQPHKIQILKDATYSNIEFQGIEHVTDTLRPWIIKYEQGIDLKLLGCANNRKYFAEFLVDALLRGDSASRAKALDIQRRNGIINANEWRGIENMNPREDAAGDEYWQPANMITVGTYGLDETVKKQSGSENKALMRSNSLLLPQNAELRQEGIKIVRNRLRNRYYGLFLDVAGQIVRREGLTIKKQAKKLIIDNKTADFNDWLENYYQNNMPTYINDKIGVTIRTYSDTIQEQVMSEIGADIDDIAEDMEVFTNKYIETYSKRHVSSSVGQMNDILTGIEEDKKPKYEDKFESVTQRADEWIEKRPDKIALNETVRVEGAIASAVILSAGYKLRWSIQGKDTCPWCQSLDGKIVGGGNLFVAGGTDLSVEGEEKPMFVRSNTLHSPLHGGCDCLVVMA